MANRRPSPGMSLRIGTARPDHLKPDLPKKPQVPVRQAEQYPRDGISVCVGKLLTRKVCSGTVMQRTYNDAHRARNPGFLWRMLALACRRLERKNEAVSQRLS